MFDFFDGFGGEAALGFGGVEFLLDSFFFGLDVVVIFLAFELDLLPVAGDLLSEVPDFGVLFLESHFGKEAVADFVEAIGGDFEIGLFVFSEEFLSSGVVAGELLPGFKPGEKVAEAAFGCFDPVGGEPLNCFGEGVTVGVICDVSLPLFGEILQDCIGTGFGGEDVRGHNMIEIDFHSWRKISGVGAGKLLSGKGFVLRKKSEGSSPARQSRNQNEQSGSRTRRRFWRRTRKLWWWGEDPSHL